MEFFLERIAGHIYEEAGDSLRHHCLVFPSRRAGTYFLKYLSGRIERPVWAPAIMTINEFFSSFSDLSIAENETLLIELYKVYRKLNPGAETFDEFYFWGDMLLSDFGDLDKYNADALALLRNVTDFREIERQFGDLEPGQAEIIRRFWKNFEPQAPTPQKTDFRSVWSILLALYTEFGESLRSRKIAYDGMIFRDVVTRIKPWNSLPFRWERVHFIGFNALNSCEQELMKQLQDKGIAKFYWDFDNSYVDESKHYSAGLFLSKNLKIFRNDMPADWKYDTYLSSGQSDVKRTIYESSTDIGQVKLLPELLGRIKDLTPENAHHTAVILADENLLVPALSSLPANIQAVNITMGYPLKMTGVYGFVKLLLNLQRNRISENGKVLFDFRDIRNILNNHLSANLFSSEEFTTAEKILKKNLSRIPSEWFTGPGNLGLVFNVPPDPAGFSDYLKKILMEVSIDWTSDGDSDQPVQDKLEREFIYRVFLAVNRLEAIVNDPVVKFRTDTYLRILDKVLRNQAVPFTGEPLAGIQLMGILETRALDFRNIIMLSVNEGVLPATGPSSSFIPFSIREAFGLPVINHQESIYAYHFYRLMHRAENVTFIYNSGSEGLRTGEMSRFLIQMKYEHPVKPEVKNLSFDIRSPGSVREEIPRTDEHQEALVSGYLDRDSSAILSPTAINMWLNCRMKFFYRYVNGLKEPEKQPGEVDFAVFGTILHSAMGYIYQPFIGKEVTGDALGSFLSDPAALQAVIGMAINDTMKKEPGMPLSGNELILKEVLGIYLSRIIKADRSITPFTLVGLEEKHEFRMQFSLNGGFHSVRTGGYIDRIDFLKGTGRMVDYKTGSVTDRIAGIEELFEEDRDKKTDCWLQTLLYCEAYLARNPGTMIRPAVYIVKELTTEKFQDMLRIKIDKANETVVLNYAEIRSGFLSGLRLLLETIFSPAEPFRMTGNHGKCSYCAYRRLCQR
jgi:hypothetical protein